MNKEKVIGKLKSEITKHINRHQEFIDHIIDRPLTDEERVIIGRYLGITGGLQLAIDIIKND